MGPDSRPCTFFRLKDVSVPDEVVESGWISIPLSHPGHDVMVSILLTAFTTGKPMNIATTGAIQCGQSEVKYVHFYYPGF